MPNCSSASFGTSGKPLSPKLSGRLSALVQALVRVSAGQHSEQPIPCGALTRTNAWTSALKRPDSFRESGFAEAREGELAQFGTAFEEGMDPYVVGQKILAGMTEQRGLILTHPEHGPDFEEIHAAIMSALPVEEAPEGRLRIEELRRKAMRDAEAGLKIRLDDLT